MSIGTGIGFATVRLSAISRPAIRPPVGAVRLIVVSLSNSIPPLLPVKKNATPCPDMLAFLSTTRGPSFMM